ncbi:thioesterase family protein [Metarhizium acridum CQMa 102]|uniref:Thioesterase family protein n=1 Tax=Metarhizium acridum (strain CQMa 102) TaxID=655827 RepID=E9E6P9_METAQ|nr:thioesterase family protein [Metarhizium acridum CQMa 102]EFY88338.1 thioesterase family protein [Metarhizium acridum CQMa 102]
MPQDIVKGVRATFSEATEVEQLGSHTYKINLHSDYCVGKVPNGGYTASCMLVAANRHLASRGQSDTFTAHFEYPNRTSSGPAVVIIDEVKLGRTLSTLHLTLWQGDLLANAPWVNTSASRRTVLGYTTHANLSTLAGISIPTGYEGTPAASLPPVPEFAALKATGSDHIWEQSRWPEVLKTSASNGNWRFYLPRQGPLSPGVLDIRVPTQSSHIPDHSGNAWAVGSAAAEQSGGCDNKGGARRSGSEEQTTRKHVVPDGAAEPGGENEATEGGRGVAGGKGNGEANKGQQV